MMRLSACISLSLLASINAATAETVTYDFTVTAHSGPLAGTTESGAFSFDGSVIKPDGTDHFAFGLFSDFSFTWNGVTYNSLTANTGEIQINPSGNFDILIFGNACNPSGSCTVSSETGQWFVDINTSNPIAPAFFEYSVSGINDSWLDGSVTVTRQSTGTPVPEPSTLSSLTIGLLALGATRYRRRVRAGQVR